MQALHRRHDESSVYGRMIEGRGILPGGPCGPKLRPRARQPRSEAAKEDRDGAQTEPLCRALEYVVRATVGHHQKNSRSLNFSAEAQPIKRDH